MRDDGGIAVTQDRLSVVVIGVNYETDDIALGTPVIAFDSAGPSESITHQYSGLLVPAGNVAALAQAMTDMHQNPQLARRLGQRGHTVVAQQFSANQMVERTLAFYDVQLTKRGSSRQD